MESEKQQLLNKAIKNLENRLGVSLYEYYGFEGIPEKVINRIERNLQKEKLKILTQHIQELLHESQDSIDDDIFDDDKWTT